MGDKRRLGRIDEAHGGREEVRKTRKIGGVRERGLHPDGRWGPEMGDRKKRPG
jgi:hypothetical protein